MIRNTVHWKDEMFPIGEGSKEDTQTLGTWQGLNW